MVTMKLTYRMCNLGTVRGAQPHPATAANFIALADALDRLRMRKAAGDGTAHRMIEALIAVTERPAL